LGNDIRVVELRLPWIQKESYATYEAEIHRVGDQRSFVIGPIQTDVARAESYTIRVRLPARILVSGQYQLELSGIGSDGAKGPAEEYGFVVSD
jgi:hypothetical protein